MRPKPQYSTFFLMIHTEIHNMIVLGDCIASPQCDVGRAVLSWCQGFQKIEHCRDTDITCYELCLIPHFIKFRTRNWQQDLQLELAVGTGRINWQQVL